MTKFQKVMEQWLQFCKSYNHCSKCKFNDKEIYDEAHLTDIPYTNIEWHIATQGAKHQKSKLVYPTWGEWLESIGVIKYNDRADNINYLIRPTHKTNTQIPAYIA